MKNFIANVLATCLFFVGIYLITDKTTNNDITGFTLLTSSAVYFGIDIKQNNKNDN